jgi:hypothetical protein
VKLLLIFGCLGVLRVKEEGTAVNFLQQFLISEFIKIRFSRPVLISYAKNVFHVFVELCRCQNF